MSPITSKNTNPPCAPGRVTTTKHAATAWLALLFSLFASAPADADGPLRQGEVVVPFMRNGVLGVSGDETTHLVRVNPNTTPPAAESMVIVDDSVVGLAVGDRNTLYLHRLSANNLHDILRVEVRTNDVIPIATFAPPERLGDVTVGHDGHPLAIVSVGTSSGRVVRINKETFEQTELMTSQHFGHAGQIKLGVNGNILLRLSHYPQPGDSSFVRAAPNGNEEPELEILYSGGAYVHVDPLSGNLIYPSQGGLLSLDPQTGNVSPLGIAIAFDDPITPILFKLDAAGNPFASTLGGVWRTSHGGTTWELLYGSMCSGILCLVDPGVFLYDFEILRPECSDGIDNDGDGLTDLNDPHCDEASEDRETSGCSDGIDNDNDGLTDLSDTEDCPDHLGEGEIPQCSDGVDNETVGGDGLIDKFDPHCANAFDDSETAECNDGIDNNNNGKTDLDDWLICASPLQACEGAAHMCPGLLPACSDGWDNDGDGYLDTEDPDCIGNAATISELPACADGVDNDGDGFSDLADVDDCDVLTGRGELSECNDGVDNDGDGFVDFPNDPDCTTISDDQELAECSDVLDNDGDGFVDLEDPDCLDPSDDAEETRQCSDGIDNDGDGATDLDDNGCNNDPNRDYEARPNACSAGSVNDSPWAVFVVILAWLVARRRFASRTNPLGRYDREGSK